MASVQKTTSDAVQSPITPMFLGLSNNRSSRNNSNRNLSIYRITYSPYPGSVESRLTEGQASSNTRLDRWMDEWMVGLTGVCMINGKYQLLKQRRSHRN